MAQISVQTTPEDQGWRCEVTVADEEAHTNHRVFVSREVYDRLAGAECSPEELVTRSFEFLLEREPKESILREFDLTVISRYFPEYERELQRRLQG